MGSFDTDRLDKALAKAQNTVTSDYNALDYGLDVGKGVFSGLRDAAEETIQFGHMLVDQGVEGTQTLFGVEDATGIDGSTGHDFGDDFLFEPLRPQTTAGQVTEDISQFVGGFLGAGKVKFIANAGKYVAKTGAIKAGGKADAVISSAAKSATSSTVAHNPYEKRLSDFVEEYPSLQNPITGYLSADEDDGLGERRLKMALEDLALTGVLETAIFAVAKGYKAYKGKKTPNEANQVIEETNSELAKTAEQAKNERSAKAKARRSAKAKAERETKRINDKALKGEDVSDIPRPKTTAFMADEIDEGAFGAGVSREDYLVQSNTHKELIAKATALGVSQKGIIKMPKPKLAEAILEKTHPKGVKFAEEPPVKTDAQVEAPKQPEAPTAEATPAVKVQRVATEGDHYGTTYAKHHLKSTKPQMTDGRKKLKEMIGGDSSKNLKAADIENKPDLQEAVKTARIGDTTGTTATAKGVKMNPTELKNVKGLMGEETFRNSGKKLARLEKNIADQGYQPSPIKVYVREDGTPFIFEGNHRLAEALKTGRKEIEVDITYLRDGEKAAKGPFNKAAIEGRSTAQVTETAAKATDEGVETATKATDTTASKTPTPRKFHNVKQIRSLVAGVKSPKDIQGVFDEAAKGKDLKLFNRTENGDVPIVNYADEVTSVIQDTITAFRPALEKVKGGVKDKEQFLQEATDRLASATNLKSDDWMKIAFAYGDSIDESIGAVLAMDAMLMESGAKMHRLFSAKNYEQSMDIQTKALAELEHFNKLLLGIKKIETATGRALRMRQEKIADVNQLLAAQTDLGGKKGIDQFRAAVIASGGDLRQVTAAAEKATMGRMKKGFYMGGELFRSMILFNIKTHVTNTLSGATETFLVPMERYVGSFLDYRKNPFGAEAQAIREDVSAHMVGLMSSFGDSIRMAKQAMILEKNMLDPAMTKIEGNETVNKISSEFLGIRKESLQGRFVDTIGKTTRGSLRLLGAEDEFFKQINYRARIFAEASKEGKVLMDAGKLDKEGFKKFVQDKVDAAFDTAGKGTDTNATQYAREITFTEELDAGSVALKLQRATQDHPTMQLILPFVRTPTNLIVRGAQRTPLASLLSRRYRDTLKNGTPVERAQMLGRVAIGTTLLGGMYSLCLQGKITGAGPANPDQNRLWRAAGNQPYSIRIDDQWVSYNRFDPLMMPVGLMANYFDMGKYLPEGDASWDDIAATATFALSTTVQDKAYLQGLTNFLDAIQSNDNRGLKKAGNIVDNFFASFIPAAPLQIVEGVQAFNAENGDGNFPELREAVGLTDKIRRRIPSLNEALPKKYNWLTGETIINPDPYSTGFPVVPTNSAAGRVGQEMTRLRYPFRGVPRTLEGIQLNSQQLSDFARYMGTVKINGKTLLQSLDQLIKMKAYSNTDERVYDGVNLTREIIAISEVLSAYRQKAKATLLQSDAELYKEFHARRVNDRAGRQLLETNR